MKTITKEQATPGVWNFIERGEFPEPKEVVLLTVHWNHQEFVIQGNFQRVDDDTWYFDDNQGYEIGDEIISWQYPPEPSKRSHKEQWMSEWVDSSEEHPWATHPCGCTYLYPHLNAYNKFIIDHGNCRSYLDATEDAEVRNFIYDKIINS